MKEILQCTVCREFTLKEICKCGGSAISIKPPKYSPDYKYGGYRREVKESERKKQDLL